MNRFSLYSTYSFKKILSFSLLKYAHSDYAKHLYFGQKHYVWILLNYKFKIIKVDFKTFCFIERIVNEFNVKYISHLVRIIEEFEIYLLFCLIEIRVSQCR